MISGSAYLMIYLFIVTVYTLVVYTNYRNTTVSVYKERSKNATLILAILLTLFIGTRPYDPVFLDTVGYVASYKSLLGEAFHFNWDAENLLFDNLFSYFASRTLGCKSLFLIIAAIYYIGTFIACKKFFPNNVLAAYIVFLGAFSTFSYSVNGIKAGAAAAIFLCALANREKKWQSIVLVLISWGFHHSMSLCVVGYLAVFIYSKPKWYFIFWFFCLSMAIGHVTYFQTFFSKMSDAKGVRYLDADNMAGWSGRTGLRLDFIIYSFMPILVGYIAIFKKKIESVLYNKLLSLYLFTNGVWLLCMYASFTNRIAYLSWFMYPIVLIYPFLSQDCSWRSVYGYKLFSVIILLHLCFTLFMNLIY